MKVIVREQTIIYLYMEYAMSLESARKKMARLTGELSFGGGLAIAFSGGVDSAFLLKAAALALPPDKILALTATAAIFPGRERAEAESLAGELGLRHLRLDFEALAVPDLAANPPDRCYHCKLALFKQLKAAALDFGFARLADGSNLDDSGDFRPGAKAVRELGIISPLKAAGLSKAEIRLLSADLGLPTWNKPAFACLASRFPYGRPITGPALRQVESAEDYLLGLGFREIRVRHHGDLARIEVGADERPRFFDLNILDRIQAELQALGFSFVALDLGGYRSGSLNRDISEAIVDKYRQ